MQSNNKGVVLQKKLLLKISQYSQKRSQEKLEEGRPATLLKRDANTGVFL